MVKLAGVLLAAGASRRMGTPKGALELDGSTFATRVLEGLVAAACSPIVVVTGVHHDAVIAALPSGHRTHVVANPAPEHGQLSSLKVALRLLIDSAPDVAGAVVALVDYPAVARDTMTALARSAATSAGRIVVPVHGGRRGHPIVLPRPLWEEVLSTPDGLGARAVVRRDPARVLEVTVDDPGVLTDVDTPDTLAALRAQSRRKQ